MSTTATNLSADLLAQHTYIQKMKQSNFDFSLMVAEAFIRGIRDIGYKSTATALDEFIDNSLQAEAENVHVVFHYSGDSNKPDKIAVIDDGHGMESEMIRMAVIWGGTHREGDRKGFGRYGYGLPSAAVSQARKFDVFSLIEGSQWYKNGLDVDDITDGKYNDGIGKVIVPESVPALLPSWLQGYIETAFSGKYGHGSVILLDKLDRLTWVTQAALERNLLEHFGVTYRNFLRQINIFVNDKKVEPTDPLFTTPGFRFYDLNEVRAEALEGLTIDVKDSKSRKVEGIVKIRYSYLPPAFTKVNPNDASSRGNNQRFEILKEHNGLVVLRMGRQIEIVPPPREWFSLQNNDRYWKVEVDFPATLDEEFSITTSKQTVRLSDRIWDNLKQAGVLKTINELQQRYDKEVKADKAKAEEADKRPSEQAMQESEKFKTIRPSEPSPEEQARRQQRLEDEIQDRSKKSGRPVEEERKDFELEIQGHPYKVLREHLPGAPFYRVEQIGGLKVLYLNTAHRFYTKLYWSPDATPYFRAAIEVLLFVIGDCELDASEDRRIFYETERGVWSARLNAALDQLDKFMSATKENEPDMAILDETSIQPALIPLD